MKQANSINVFGEVLESCSEDPLTGFYRDGCCNTSDGDLGSHTVCVLLTDDFLTFSKDQGNDLITPQPQYDFPGLKAGQRWCLCASRWLQAYVAGCAPRVYLKRTHLRALEIVPMEQLRELAIDLD
ncbi:DUF2237 family protein [Marinicella sp. W31]|uniref:DUF2237 family protein n=1 Tax=Marinicella sp. W31 TaxID=3023713 RepID=UPI0037565F30